MAGVAVVHGMGVAWRALHAAPPPPPPPPKVAQASTPPPALPDASPLTLLGSKVCCRTQHALRRRHVTVACQRVDHGVVGAHIGRGGAVAQQGLKGGGSLGHLPQPGVSLQAEQGERGDGSVRVGVRLGSSPGLAPAAQTQPRRACSRQGAAALEPPSSPPQAPPSPP